MPSRGIQGHAISSLSSCRAALAEAVQLSSKLELNSSAAFYTKQKANDVSLRYLSYQHGVEKSDMQTDGLDCVVVEGCRHCSNGMAWQH